MHVAQLIAPSGERRELNGSRTVVPGNGHIHPTEWAAKRALRAFLNQARQAEGWQGIVIDTTKENL